MYPVCQVVLLRCLAPGTASFQAKGNINAGCFDTDQLVEVNILSISAKNPTKVHA